MSNQQLIIYQSQTDFIQNIIDKHKINFLSQTTPDGLYYKHIYKPTPCGNMPIPTSNNPTYKQYNHWLSQSYIYQLVNPPLFYSD